jgi:hypothetical protein
MNLKGFGSGEGFRALRTAENLFPGVQIHVGPQRILRYKGFPTLRTAEQFLACVMSFMFL